MEKKDDFARVNFGTCHSHDGGRLVQFSPSGRLLASAGGFDFKCVVWDVETQTAQLSDNKSAKNCWFTALAFGPHDQHICSTTKENTISIRDLRDRSAASTIRSGHSSKINSLKMSDDEQKIMSASDDRQIKLWDLRNLSEPVERVRVDHPVRQIAFGSKTLAIALEWNPAATELGVSEFRALSSDSKKTRCRIATGLHTTLQLSPSTELVAVASPLYQLRLYNTRRIRERLICCCAPEHSSRIVGAQFAAQEKCLITGSYDRSIRVWDIATGKPTRQVTNLEDVVMSLSTIPNSPGIKAAAILANGRVCMFG